MKFALVTDAWMPQVNGVVRTWFEVTQRMEALNYRVFVVHPGLFRTVAVPKYPEIRLSLFARNKVASILEQFQPDAIHIATEGPLGLACRGYCRKRRIPFTTSYHTQYAKYLRIYYRVPPAITWSCLRRFHRAAARTLVPTRSVARELASNGVRNLVVWCRGVDTDVFKPWGKDALSLPRPIFMTVSRIAPEKNIEAFLDLNLPGSKVVVGDGPARAALERRYPLVHWTGYQYGEELARLYAAADVFVFPSVTDTFGISMLEANACGVPVAAHPVTGPIDVVRPNATGVLNSDLRAACLEALNLDSQSCVEYARSCSWEKCAQTFIDSLEWIRRPIRHSVHTGLKGWEYPRESLASAARTSLAAIDVEGK
jgi:glycosyltransferase involved in cell wall biosynthesis